MDPDATLLELLIALRNNDKGDASRAAYDLSMWFSKGGAMPSLTAALDQMRESKQEPSLRVHPFVYKIDFEERLNYDVPVGTRVPLLLNDPADQSDLWFTALDDFHAGNWHTRYASSINERELATLNLEELNLREPLTIGECTYTYDEGSDIYSVHQGKKLLTSFRTNGLILAYVHMLFNQYLTAGGTEPGDDLYLAHIKGVKYKLSVRQTRGTWWVHIEAGHGFKPLALDTKLRV